MPIRRGRFICIGNSRDSFSDHGKTRPGGLVDMINLAVEIPRSSLAKKVKAGQLQKLSDYLGYATHHKKGLTMASDDSLKYFRSTLFRKPVMFIQKGSVMYILAEDQNLGFIKSRMK